MLLIWNGDNFYCDKMTFFLNKAISQYSHNQYGAKERPLTLLFSLSIHSCLLVLDFARDAKVASKRYISFKLLQECTQLLISSLHSIPSSFDIHSMYPTSQIEACRPSSQGKKCRACLPQHWLYQLEPRFSS